MREVHARIKTALREVEVDLQSATAVEPGTSILGHINPHRGNQYLVAYDIKSAYSNVDPSTLCMLLLARGVPSEIVDLVREFAFVDGALATGGPAAPQLFNFYAAEVLDGPLRQLIAERGDIQYTRYLDDLLFSSRAPIGRRFRKEILEVIRAAGFEHSRDKAQVIDLAECGHATINGIGLRITGEVFVPRGFRRELHDLIKSATWMNDDLIVGMMGAFYAIAPPYRYASKSERRIMDMFREFKRSRLAPEQIEKRRARRLRYERNRRRRNFRHT